jgi:hypothetical protein
MEIEDLDYTIQCRLPGERRYRNLLACIIREDRVGGVLGDMRSPKALLAA